MSREPCRLPPCSVNVFASRWPACARGIFRASANIYLTAASAISVSPQTPDNSLTTAEKRHLTFPVLSDLGNVVADRYGLTFTVDVAVRDAQAALGLDLEAYNGDASYRLPVTATYVIGRDAMIALARVSGDYRERAEPSEILAALNKL